MIVDDDVSSGSSGYYWRNIKSDDSCIIEKPADTEQLIKKINKVIDNRIRKEGKAIEV